MALEKGLIPPRKVGLHHPQSADSPLRFFVVAAVAKVREALLSRRRATMLRYLRLPASNEAEAAS